MADNARLQTVLEHIQANQGNWNQIVWSSALSNSFTKYEKGCGTTYCTAGWATVLFAPDVDATKNDTQFAMIGKDVLDLTTDQKYGIFYFYAVRDLSKCTDDCYSELSYDARVEICGYTAEHNRHPTFEELVAQVEKFVPDFTYTYLPEVA